MFFQTNSTKAATGFTSTSLDRTPGPSSNFVRGKSGYMPFRPGGLEDILVNDLDQKTPLTNKSLRTIPPGFLRGLRLPTDPIENDDTFSFEADGSYVLEEQGIVRMVSQKLLSIITLALERERTCATLR